MADETTLPERPASSGSKPEWVAYAKAYGVDSSGTRDEIRARVEAAEAAGGPEHQPETVNFAAAADADPAAEPEESSRVSDADDAEQPAVDADQPAEAPAATAGPAPVGTVTRYRLLPSADEPIRAGGHVLTDQGWIAEATLTADDATDGEA
ncbi:hypothetical protein [Amycolatopsis solani]|uniref:hypothetical protein n=1 Tax=Amycolatopsis solani TaxID=3028615 RepID=UPI0025AF40A1|nr:hypothetical protein [Amycolatopsis sp. MEP2-6]